MWCVKAKMDGHAAFILTLCSFSLLFMDACPFWVAGLCVGMNLLMLAFLNFSSEAVLVWLKFKKVRSHFVSQEVLCGV